ncbi:MAG: BON domain-containing protein [Arenicella sp.]
MKSTIKSTMKQTTLTFIALLAIILNGCTTIVDATTKDPIQPDPSQRSLGTYIDDKRLQVIIGVNLRKADPALKQSHINVTSFNGVVLLSGQVPTQEMRLLAAQTASQVTSVRQVHNELQVKGNTAILARTNDSWLATKVKSVLIANKDIKSLKIKTVVEDGVVYLMGLVTQAEANNIANVVSNIGGIKEVVRVFEYIN